MTERSPPSRAVPEPPSLLARHRRRTSSVRRETPSDSAEGDSAERYGEVDITNIDWPRNAKPVLLIVEDDETFAGMLAELATEAGFDSVITASGRTALALAREHQPAAITLDIGLPDMAGWVVLDVLKHELATRHIPVNVISGTSDDGRGRRMGAIHTLNKPADAATLRSMFTATANFLKPGSRHVLVAEDDANQRQVVTNLMESDDLSIDVGQHRQRGAGGAGRAEILRLPRPRSRIARHRRNQADRADPRSVEPEEPPGHRSHRPRIDGGRNSASGRTGCRHRVENAKSPERLLDETALFLHRVADDMPAAARAILSNPQRLDDSLEGNTVLLVDDDMRNVFALGNVLKNYDITVLPASNGQEGLETLAAHPEVDLVLMDMMMPVMDGYEAMRRIRRGPVAHSPIVALTAKAMKGDRQKCLDAGASDYITKPVDIDQLSSVLRVWLAHRSRRPSQTSEA